MNSLLDTLEQQLNPAAIQQISSSLGADPKTTSNAISTALDSNKDGNVAGDVARIGSSVSGGLFK